MSNEHKKNPETAAAVGNIALSRAAGALHISPRALIYAAVAAGFVFNKPSVSPSPANLKAIGDLAEAILELMESRG